MSLKVQVSLANKIGFASHQNAVAILQDLSVINEGTEALRDLVVILSADPGFLETKIWKVDLLASDSEVRVTDREIHLSAGFLADLVESVRGTVNIEVRLGAQDGEVLCHEAFSVEVLAKAHWGGTASMPELLPAFCMPNDPAVDKVLSGAGDVLRRAGKDPGIDGYAKRSRSRTWELASAIWSSVAGLGIGYALPPASFEKRGQKVRTPGAILEGRLATCLDTSMLFASALEQASLNPLIILTEGHAFVGVWLQPQEFSQLVTEEALAVRKRVELQEMLVFETTMVTAAPAAPFSSAVDAGIKKLDDDEFHMAIDIRRARMRKIRPLGFTSPVIAETETVGPVAPAESLEEAPPLPGFDVEIIKDPETPDDRVAQWQRKLLDLTTRNRLLHLPERSKHVPLECPDPGALEDRLAAGKTIRISPFPDLEEGGRDTTLYQLQNKEELHEQYAHGALDSNEVLSPLPKKKLEADLIDLYRKANSDMAEGGANTLFLALGFLNWKKTPEDPRSYRAPLILLPVKLKRKSALSGVVMTEHEDEARFNLTLLELLSHDFDLDIAGLDGDLPEDASGIDVSRIWNHVRVAVKEIPGFEVTTETAIATFSFAKYLMWKDLTDRREQLTANAVVKHLVERGEEMFGNDSEYPNERDLDALIDPASLFTPLPADSSQLAAVFASGRSCNFILDGPPGTGKSQTIANMIVHNLSMGRRVLFVAEKMAALDVVFRRLEEKGLGEFCLELHSHKTSKVDILRQLERAWDVRGELSVSHWERETNRLRTLRDRLNNVCERLHYRHANGMSVHQAIGRVVRDHDVATPRLSWNTGVEHNEEELEGLRETARRLDLNHAAYAEAPSDFSIIEQSEWSHNWQDSVLGVAKGLPPKIAGLQAACEQLVDSCQFQLAANNEPSIERLLGLAKLILKTHRKDLAFAFTPDLSTKLEAADQFIGLLAEYRREESELSVSCSNETARKVDADLFEADWTTANGKFWFFATLARKKVARELANVVGAPSPPDVPKDIPHLRQMKELLSQMDGLVGSLTGIPGYAGSESKVEVIEEAVAIAKELQSALPQLTTNPDEFANLKGSTKRLVVDVNELLGSDGPIGLAAHGLEGALCEFRECYQRFTDLCGLTAPESLSLHEIRVASLAITASETQLKSWCIWRRVRRDAIHQRLEPLVSAIEDGRLAKGEVEPAFQTAYSKWFAAEIVDREPVLREFVAAEHIDRIEEFRSVDEEVAKLTVEYTRTALASRLPTKSEVGKKDGYGILKHEIQKKRRHKPLRQLATEMGESFGFLAPCMLMSPLSIAQYLPADQQLFDLVIFDEASQIAPWDAVGSIARGEQVVIAGDPKQMPPTNFFQRGTTDSDFDGSVEGDLESILDECLAVGIPRHSLSWHYRSRHESLIAFSNHSYYGGNLITFPAAETRATAVDWRRVDGTYAKGKTRTNQAEAEAIVAETVERLLDPAFVSAGRSIGIITLNADQQALIEDLLDAARKTHPEIEPHFDDSLTEPVVVKNLETVQGDERDVILLGIGYGPTEPGAATMSMNFGPLNRDGGERRLNVALTRSKREMIVFTSFDPSMIDLNRTSARAVRDLKHFLEFAERGPRALAEAVMGSVGGYDSPFEESVANRLRERGWEVVPQVGVSRFRIDLGIVHPDRPGDFLVGVECDGATYHSAATARDRDKVRAAVLEDLGWKLLRVWSTDWFVAPEQEIEKLDQALRILHAADEGPREVASPADDSSDESKEIEGVVIASAGDTETACEIGNDDAIQPREKSSVPSVYKLTDYSELAERIDPDQFYEEDYTPLLIELIRVTLECEAPIADDLMVKRIARAHNFKRTGRLIRERVLDLAEEQFHIREDPEEGSFVWLNEHAVAVGVPMRQPSDEDATRRIEEIPSEELLAGLAHTGDGDPVREIARLFGIFRLSANARERIQKAIATEPSKPSEENGRQDCHPS